MNISKNVIRDLLPVYVAGEASDETRSLVAAALAEDGELRAEAHEMGSVPSMPTPPAPLDLGIVSLKHTQRLLRRHTILVGFSYFFTALTFAFVARSGSVWYKVAATACYAAGLAGWATFLRNALRLRDSGLQPRYSLWPQFYWMAGAWSILAAGGMLLYDWTHWQFLSRQSGMVTVLAVTLASLGHRLKLYRAGAELVTPVETLLTLQKRHDLEEEE